MIKTKRRVRADRPSAGEELAAQIALNALLVLADDPAMGQYMSNPEGRDGC